jgi:polyhydroxyalkanoate synthesis regulator phasin
MLKLTSRDKELIVLLVSCGIVAVSWFFGAQKIREMTDELEVKNNQLSEEYNRKMRILEKKEQYLQDTENYNQAYQLMMEQYPGGLAQDQQILFVTNLEREFDTEIVSVAYSDPESIYTFQSVEPQNDQPYELESSMLSVPMDVTYDEWKRLIEYIFAYQDKDTIPGITSSYDAVSGLVNAQVTMQQYAVTGEDIPFEQQQAEAPAGTDNIFTSGSPLAYGGSVTEQIQTVISNYDCYLMLYPTASDVKAKVIAGRDDVERVTSGKNAEETLVIKAEDAADGTGTITYTLGKNRPHALTSLDGETINLYVLSTERRGEKDLSGVRVQIENASSRQLRIAVTGDDSTAPRFNVESTSGEVQILR